jgi:hypothetical protein
MDREAKRKRDTEPQPNKFLLLGRELQNKRGPPGAWASAEQDFREFLGQVVWWWQFFGGC